MSTFTLHPQLQQDSIHLLDFPLCSLLLANDKQYPWFILVPRVADISEIYQLDWQQQQQLSNESSLLGEFIMQEFHGDKLNVAALGNVVNQLHVHHVVRFTSDKSWPKPIWGQHPTIAYSADELNAIKLRLIPALQAIIK